MNRLPPPCIIDSAEFRFPVENQTTGQKLKPVWIARDGKAVRCRMRDLKKGDLFYVHTPPGLRLETWQASDQWWAESTSGQWWIADTDAWFHAGS